MKLPEAKYTVSAVNHKYTILMPNGESIGPLNSVTGVLSVIDKPALKGWAARMAAQHFKTEILRLGAAALNASELERIAKEAQSAHTKFTKDAADLGTACHDAFEAIILGKEPENLPPELVEPVNAFKNYRLQSDIEVVATELMVASANYRTGGCLDFIGYSKSRGGWGIGDYKTSSGFYGNEYAYQAGGGYALMVEEMYGIDIKWAEIVRFAKKPPYESEARPVTDVRSAIQGFLNALMLTRSNEMKLIGEATFKSAGVPVVASAVDGKAPAKKSKAKVGAGLGF